MPSTTPARLRILSANLANGRAEPRAFADLVRELRPDVVAVQELSPAQSEVLEPLMPHGRLEPQRNFLGMGISVRRPATFEHLPLEFRNARVATLEPAHWPQLPRPVEVVNVHITSPVAGPRLAEFVRRRLQIRGLTAYLDATRGRTRAVVGDFNATPLWAVYRRMAARLEDVARTHAQRQGRRPERTWRYWLDGPRLLRIDHCFAHGLDVESLRVLDVAGSDHCALLVDFKLE